MADLKRWGTLALSMLVGLCAAGAHAVLTWETRINSPSEWVRHGAVMEACCIFFGVIYWTGRTVAWLLGAQSLQREILRRSRWHMGVLHGTLGATILLARGLKLRQERGVGVGDGVMIGIGIALLALSWVYFVRGPRKSEQAL